MGPFHKIRVQRGPGLGPARRRHATPGGVLPSLVLDFRRRVYAAGTPLAQRQPLDSLLQFTRTGAGWHVDAAGALVSAPANVPRLDHDPASGLPLGLLIEEARSNLLARAAAFGSAPWVAIDAQTIAQTGGGVALLAGTGGGTGLPRLVQTVALPAGLVPVTFWAVVAAGEALAAPLRLSATAPGGPDLAAVFDPASGAVLAQAADPALLQAFALPMGGGHWQVGLTLIAPAGAETLSCGIGIVADAAGGAVALDGAAGALLTRAQAEIGEQPGSWIATDAAPVARAADEVRLPLGDWFTPDAGTLVLHYARRGTDRMCVIGSDTSPQNRLFLSAQTARMVSGTTTYSSSLATPPGPSRVALAVDPSGIEVAVDGSSLGPSGDTIASGAAGTLTLGSNAASGAQWLNGHLAALIFYPSRLAPADLEAVTAQGAG